MTINWTADLNTGIDVIDHQHRRIVDFINDLEAAQVLGDQKQIKQVIYDCVDYTLSHFAFEESLQEEAGYPYCKPHKKVHELFTRKVVEYQERMELGDDVAEELHAMLARWLVNHIKRDDADYVSVVKANMAPAAAAVVPQEQISLTPQGEKFAEKLYQSLSNSQKSILKLIKGKLASAPLRAILKYVYTNYPETIERSEIKNEVLND